MTTRDDVLLILCQEIQRINAVIELTLALLQKDHSASQETIDTVTPVLRANEEDCNRLINIIKQL